MAASPGPHHAEPGEENRGSRRQDREQGLADAEAECPDRKPEAIEIPVPSGPQYQNSANRVNELAWVGIDAAPSGTAPLARGSSVAFASDDRCSWLRQPSGPTEP